jgi:dihydropteroate synthase
MVSFWPPAKGPAVSRTVSDLPQLTRPLVMGVLNVTPDSFSDGGEWFDPADAIAHGRQLVAEGADLVDVGGESTRPGAGLVGAEEELRRVLPVIRQLVRDGVLVSIDTMHARVAEGAVAAGARVVNDVSGGRADPDMLAVVAELDVPYVCMHWRAHSAEMQSRAVYDDVVAEVVAELTEQVGAALAAGVRRDHLVVDPGIGFAKRAEHNWEILRRLSELDVLALPVLIGVSRKTFLGTLLADGAGDPRPAAGRDDATVALSALTAHQVWGVRVHRVRPSRDAIAVAQSLRSSYP